MAFYTYARFIAPNEVGGKPGIWGTSLASFHKANASRNTHFPRAMITTGTHDTKRGEGLRMRLAVLTEIPDQWHEWITEWERMGTNANECERMGTNGNEWERMGQRFVRTMNEETSPSRIDEYLFFQTALGAEPLEEFDAKSFCKRLVAYAVKAAREAKQHTSWLAPDEGYEEALRSWVIAMLNDPHSQASLAAKADVIAPYGASNALAMALLEIASPGVADRYQGSGVWDLRLVDPDNRAPVDYAHLRKLISGLGNPSEMRVACRDSRIKLHVVREALRLRRAHPDVFVGGSYEPIHAGDDITAFSRGDAAIFVTTRRRWGVMAGKQPWAIGAAWKDRTLPFPNGTFRDVLTGQTVEGGTLALETLLKVLPVALLLRH